MSILRKLICVAIWVSPFAIRALTITLDLQDGAVVDVIFSTQNISPIPPNTIRWPYNAAIIARYSARSIGNAIYLWSHIYPQGIAQGLTDRWIFPEHRLTLPADEGIVPYVLIVPPELIEQLAGDSLTTVYVTVAQETFCFDTKAHVLRPMNTILLMQESVPLSQTMTISARGSIAPSRLASVPSSMQGILIEAQADIS